MSKIDYTLWPNANGTLGQNKVEIPDGVNTKWPDGDALVGNFVYDGGKLVGFVDTKALINNGSKTSSINYDFVDIHLENIGEGDITFNLGERCKNFTVTYGSTFAEEVFKYKGCTTVDEVKTVDPDYLTNDIVDGAWTQSLADLKNGNPTIYDRDGMFYNCTALTTFTSDLSKLSYGRMMFERCSNLTTFNADLSSLENGYMMFASDNSLTSFNCSNLSSLVDGQGMFQYCSNLTTWDTDLSSLTECRYMFYECTALNSVYCSLASLTNGIGMFHNCTTLGSFYGNLSSLTNGQGMFFGCTSLSTFYDSLSSLTNGTDMFEGCQLNTTSVQTIADSISSSSNLPATATLIIDIGIQTQYPNLAEEAAFNSLSSKGWTVYVNGSQYTPTSPASLTTLDETGETIETPIPFYAKPVPATEETASYVDSEGNFYNVLGAQFIYGDDLSTYGMFTCETDAVANMRLTKYERPVIETV